MKDKLFSEESTVLQFRVNVKGNLFSTISLKLVRWVDQKY